MAGSWSYDRAHLEGILEKARGDGMELAIFQLPEGLRTLTQELAAMETRGLIHAFDTGQCYGACHLPPLPRTVTSFPDASKVILIQFGHEPIPELSFRQGSPRIVFVQLARQIGLPDQEMVRRIVGKIGSKFLLAGSFPHDGILEKMKKLFESSGATVSIRRGDRRISREGQVLGCNFTAISARSFDTVAVISDGMFHPLGAALSRPEAACFWIDPSSWEARELGPEKERLLRKRFASIESCRGFVNCRGEDGREHEEQKEHEEHKGHKNSGTVGILVSTAEGQARLGLAARIKERAIAKGLTPIVFTCHIFDVPYLSYLPADFFVSTACPRIALDDRERMKKPVLTPFEFDVLLGDAPWDEYRLDSICEGSQLE